MVQQSSNQGVLVPLLQGRVAADPDHGFVPDLLAAASILDTPPPAPEDDCQLDMLGDITEEELHDFLGSQSPSSLLNDVSLSPKTAASASRCIALPSPAVSVRLPSLPSSFVAAPLSPSNSDSDESAAETVISPNSPVRSAPLVSPSVSSAATAAGRDETPPWFADADQDEWEDPYSAVNLILAAQDVTERPPLADPPEFHPRSHAENLCYKANAPFDPDQVWQVRLLIDRYGELPHVAFLVEWETEGVQLSWEWPENLKGVYWCMNQVNAWINSCKRIPFYAYFDRHFRGAGASETNMCFLYSFQAACYGLGQDGLVNSGHWNRFCCVQKKKFPNGVLTREIDAFFNFIRAEGVPLDYLQLFKKVQKFSMTTVAELERKALQFPDGCYIVHAAQHYVEHCFALVVNHDPAKQGFPVMVLMITTNLQIRLVRWNPSASWIGSSVSTPSIALPPMFPRLLRSRRSRRFRRNSDLARN